jgi:hypothetical protein
LQKEILKHAKRIWNQLRAGELEYPEWQEPLHEALLESDKVKLRVRVVSAEASIFGRLQAISHSADPSGGAAGDRRRFWPSSAFYAN